MKPLVAGLDAFGLRVLNNIWTAIQKHYPDEVCVLVSGVKYVTLSHQTSLKSILGILRCIYFLICKLY